MFTIIQPFNLFHLAGGRPELLIIMIPKMVGFNCETDCTYRLLTEGSRTERLEHACIIPLPT